VENPTRRRVLAAGVTGTALGLLGGRVASASADTTPTTDGGSTPATTAAPATTTTAPPQRPTPEDVVLLNFAEAVELSARDLYQVAIGAGTKGDVVNALADNHRGYADVIRGMLGTRSVGVRDPGVYQQYESQFKVADIAALSGPALELESALVATHTEMLRKLVGTDGARRLASILIVEARQAAVLADIGGAAGDFDKLFTDTATALTPSGG
jgi:Ferritin-like domain